MSPNTAKAHVIEHPSSKKKLSPEELARPVFDHKKIIADFPILKRPVHGKRLVYLDNGATSQKPECVIDALVGYYKNYNANVHRGIHTLAEEATSAYEATRTKVAQFLGGTDSRQVVFTKGTTESLNLVALGWGEHFLKQGDEILLTEMEHHANLVPWVMLARRKGLVLKHIPIDREGKLDLSRLDKLLTKKTKIVSVTHLSNVLGTINPVRQIADRAHEVGALMVVDGAQSAPHIPVNVEQTGADFYAFSAHKMLGPTGVGVLWGKMEALEKTEPHMGGGEMIKEVTLDSVTWNNVPWKFEAGTPNIADVVAFSNAIEYLMDLGMEKVRLHDLQLTQYTLEKMLELGHITIYGPPQPEDRAAVVTFNDNNIHPHDLSTILDHYGVAIRAGHHCAQPLMKILGTTATSRASFSVYNTTEDIDVLIESLREARKYFGYQKS
jgi:cysteine desulfurase / selenocysteine lyase